jgi:ribosomal protein S18 acetylase RimI-like enzyme
MLTFGSWVQAFLLPYRLVGCDQQPLGHSARLRNATFEDIDGIAEVIIAAFAPLPSWQYLYQFREDYPEEHKKCLGYGVTQALEDPAMRTEVIEAPTNGNITVVAVAIWTADNSRIHTYADLLNGKSWFDIVSNDDGTTNAHAPQANCTHKDLNITRAVSYDHQFTAEKRKHVDQPFGHNQMYLDLLGTHPQYQLRGAGTRLVRSGIERAAKRGGNVTLIAQPTAEGFYLRLGFVEVVNISIASVDRDRDYWFNVMRYDFQR